MNEILKEYLKFPKILIVIGMLLLLLSFILSIISIVRNKKNKKNMEIGSELDVNKDNNSIEDIMDSELSIDDSLEKIKKFTFDKKQDESLEKEEIKEVEEVTLKEDVKENLDDEDLEML